LAAAKEGDTPRELLSRTESVLSEIGQVREAVEKQRGRALTMQSRIGVQDSRIADMLRSLGQSRENALRRLFLRDSPPIWSPTIHSAPNFQEESLNSFSRQWESLSTYAERQTPRFAAGIAIVAALTVALFWIRRGLRAIPDREIEVCRAVPVFEMPIAAALILSLLAGRWIFPQAPRLLWATLGALALIPSVIILRRLVSSDLHFVLHALLAFFFFDQARSVAAAVPFLPRLLFLLEMFGTMILSLWILRFTARRPRPNSNDPRSHRALRLAGTSGLIISTVGFLANCFGYVTFSTFLGGALLASSYLALILYASIEVLDGLVMIALSLRFFDRLGAVYRHRSVLRRRIRHALQLLAICLWIVALLQRLLLREQLSDAALRFLQAQLVVGSIRISAEDLLAFGLIVWFAFLVSRFVRFLLDEDIYPRVRLKRGLSYAISNTLHYLILIIGFFVAVAALGFDMTRVTILAGAFSVGVGFGLQNIFNNFISGLILLIERPINIGDVVQVEDASGVVERIGIRASIIRTTNGSQVIMPNGKLISERLINSTLSGQQHEIELPIAVEQSCDPGYVISLLEQTAAGQPLISGQPPPRAFVIKLGQDSVALELRAWTDHREQWMQIRSELAIAVRSALAGEKIAIR
jgi:small-conductance mechanosensitive channel